LSLVITYKNGVNKSSRIFNDQTTLCSGILYAVCYKKINQEFSDHSACVTLKAVPIKFLRSAKKTTFRSNWNCRFLQTIMKYEMKTKKEGNNK
jgi:hypothetical protein